MNTQHRLCVALMLSLLPACAPVDGVDQTASELSLGDGVTVSTGTLGGVANLPPLQLAQPSLTGFTPSSGRVGDHVVLQGQLLDRARAGRYVLAGGLGYAVTFAGAGNTRVTASQVTRLSATQLDVVVPPQSATGPVQLVDGIGVLSTTSASFTVVQPPPPPPAPTFLRVINNNQYDLVSVAINGVPVSNCANPIAPGASRDFQVMPGMTTAAVVAGWCNGGAATSLPPSALVGQVTIAAGVTGTLSLAPFTLGELMTNWGSNSGQWASGFFVGSDGNLHENSFFFDGSARWTARQDGQQWGAGQAFVTSWPARSQCVSFRLANNAAVTQLCAPFSGFVFDGVPHVRR